MIKGPNFLEERPIIIPNADVKQKCLEIKAEGYQVLSVEQIDEKFTKVVYKVLYPDFHG